MRLPSRSERPYLMAHASRFFVAIVIALVFEATLEAKTSTVSGVIFTLGSDKIQTVWPNARVTLKNVDTRQRSRHSLQRSRDVRLHRRAVWPL